MAHQPAWGLDTTTVATSQETRKVVTTSREQVSPVRHIASERAIASRTEGQPSRQISENALRQSTRTSTPVAPADLFSTNDGAATKKVDVAIDKSTATENISVSRNSLRTASSENYYLKKFGRSSDAKTLSNSVAAKSTPNPVVANKKVVVNNPAVAKTGSEPAAAKAPSSSIAAKGASNSIATKSLSQPAVVGLSKKAADSSKKQVASKTRRPKPVQIVDLEKKGDSSRVASSGESSPVEPSRIAKQSAKPKVEKSIDAKKTVKAVAKNVSPVESVAKATPKQIAPTQTVSRIQRLPRPLPETTFQLISGQITDTSVLSRSSRYGGARMSPISFQPGSDAEEAASTPDSKQEGPLDNMLGDAANGQEKPSLTNPPKQGEKEGRIGQPPVDNSLEFLRQQTVLLDPGEMQLDIGLSYSLFENDFPDLAPGSLLVEGQVRERELIMPVELRYGLSQYAQLFLNVPVGWVNTEVSRVGFDLFENGGGLGDIRGGLTWQIRESSGCGCDPDIVTTFGFTAPTGNESLYQLLLGSPRDALGEGVWAGSWNLLFIHTYDPVVVFYGLGSRHRVARNFQGVRVAPGDEYYYQLGLGFAVNESVTLSTSFLGAYITEPKLDGVRVQGLIQEPMRLRFAATIANACRCSIVEPFAEIGMTDDAPAARIGMTFTY